MSSTRTKSRKLNAARRHALAIIKLATGRPTPGALFAAFDYRESVGALYEHVPTLTAVDAEDLHLILVAHALLRAGQDAERDPSFQDQYTARLQDAASSALWASAYVRRCNAPKRTGARRPLPAQKSERRRWRDLSQIGAAAESERVGV